MGDADEHEDWQAVARAVADRLAETRMTQMDVASKARVSLTTLRELQHNLNPRRRRPQTLSAVSEALGWPRTYLSDVLAGRRPTAHTDEETDPVLAALRSVEDEVTALRERVAQIERRLAGGGE